MQDLTDARIPPFDLDIRGINSFATAPFLEVSDPGGGIQRIRNLLFSTHSEIRMETYVPHLTQGT
ncbi:MAG: hypothetical protein R6U38_07160 [Desulfatiglandaceae bacterium]